MCLLPLFINKCCINLLDQPHLNIWGDPSCFEFTQQVICCIPIKKCVANVRVARNPYNLHHEED